MKFQKTKQDFKDKLFHFLRQDDILSEQDFNANVQYIFYRYVNQR